MTSTALRIVGAYLLASWSLALLYLIALVVVRTVTRLARALACARAVQESVG